MVLCLSYMYFDWMPTLIVLSSSVVSTGPCTRAGGLTSNNSPVKFVKNSLIPKKVSSTVSNLSEAAEVRIKSTRERPYNVENMSPS